MKKILLLSTVGATKDIVPGAAGTYTFLFGASSRDIRCTATAEANAAETPAHRVLL